MQMGTTKFALYFSTSALIEAWYVQPCGTLMAVVLVYVVLVVSCLLSVLSVVKVGVKENRPPNVLGIPTRNSAVLEIETLLVAPTDILCSWIPLSVNI